MKNLIFIIIISLLPSLCFGQFTQQWVARYNDPADLQDDPYALAIDNEGNLYVTGSTSNNSPVSCLTTVKFNSSGNQQWVQRYYGIASGPNYAAAIKLDKNNNVYVVGTACVTSANQTDIVTIKYNSSGVQKWLRSYCPVGEACWGRDIAIDNSENIYVTGTKNISGNRPDFVTIRYDTSGQQRWDKVYNGPGDNSDSPSHITTDLPGNIYVAGISWMNDLFFEYAVVKYNAKGVQQWVARQFGSDITSERRCGIAVDRLGNLYLAGSSGYATQQSIFTAKYNSAGSVNWVSMYNIPEGYAQCEASDMVLDSLGNSYVTGYVYGGINGSIFGCATLKYNSEGIRQWISIYSRHCYPNSGRKIIIDRERNLYVCGYAEDSITSSYDFFTVKYNNNGGLVWNATYDGPGHGNDLANRIVLDNYNNVYVSGESAGVTSGSDFAVIKYSQPIGINTINSEVPRSFNLYQNYPNPFNPSTTIKFDIPPSNGARGMTTRLVIYDLLGREVTTLINKQLQPGSYSVDWDASNFPSGVYFYKLVVGDNTNNGGFVQSKKMVLIK